MGITKIKDNIDRTLLLLYEANNVPHPTQVITSYVQNSAHVK